MRGNEGHFHLYGGVVGIGVDLLFNVMHSGLSAVALTGLGLFDFDIHIDRSSSLIE